MRFHDDCDAAGRWVFEIEHPCGHREIHRIRTPQPDGRLGFPSDAERVQIRGQLESQPCHGCLSGQIEGRAIGILSRRRGVPR